MYVFPVTPSLSRLPVPLESVRPRNTSGSGTINQSLSSMKQRLMPGPQVFKITRDEDGPSPPSRCRHRALFVTLEVTRVTSNYSPDFIALETFCQQLLPTIIP